MADIIFQWDLLFETLDKFELDELSTFIYVFTMRIGCTFSFTFKQNDRCLCNHIF